MNKNEILNMMRDFSTYNKLHFFVFAFAYVFLYTKIGFAAQLPVATPSSSTSVIADSPCDALYYESLSARAWLEAQREITQNQNIILKPDSVFQYTCFDRMVGELSSHAQNMLTGSTAYGQPISTASMQESLNNLVNATLITYLGNSYDNGSLLGGHTAALGIFHDPALIGSSSMTSYSCDIMGRVWQAAKCINMVTNSETDGFYTFQQYASPSATDKRHLPTACQPITGNWTGNLNAALTSGPWTNDPVETYISMTAPDDCTGNDCQCDGAPIPTGLRVITSNFPNGYDEHVCIQPGCRFRPNTSGTGGGCYAN